MFRYHTKNTGENNLLGIALGVTLVGEDFFAFVAADFERNFAGDGDGRLNVSSLSRTDLVRFALLLGLRLEILSDRLRRAFDADED